MTGRLQVAVAVLATIAATAATSAAATASPVRATGTSPRAPHGAEVPAAEVGAPPGSHPVVPPFPLQPARVQASALAGPVLAYGSAATYGSFAGVAVRSPLVGMARTPTGHGYWIATASGGVYALGDAHYHGSAGYLHLDAPIVGIAATPSGNGYWLVASDGGIFSFGDAHFHGSTGGMHLWAPVLGMAATPSGNGYWLVASDGGIFSFGDAVFRGSTGGMQLWAPIVGMATTPTGHGYWLVGSDGGIFTFGDAHFAGSAGGIRGGPRFVGINATPDGHGYWLLESSPPDVFTPDLVAALNGRAGVISAAVHDLTTGATYEYRPGQLGITASIVKVQILGTLLAQAQAQHRGLDADEQSLATRMIEQSDNDAATALWDDVGRAPAVHAFDQLAGMSATTPNSAWGLTTTTAVDQINLLQHLIEPNSLLSDSSRAYELSLMEHVTPSQAWGVSAGTAPGTTVALKNGWLPVGSGWTVNSIGWVSGYGRNYLIAVTTSGDPGMSYGIDSISLIATAAWNALAH